MNERKSGSLEDEDDPAVHQNRQYAPHYRGGRCNMAAVNVAAANMAVVSDVEQEPESSRVPG